MQKAINRFWDWLFHPAIRKYSNPKGKAIIYRYPSPGNAPLEPVMPTKEQDYKTPYAHTHYNVRYASPTPMQTKQTNYEVHAAALCSDPILRLKKVGLLKRGEENNIDAVAAAKKKFQQKYGFSADETSIYKNDGEFNMLRSTNREEVAAYIQNFYQDMKQMREDSLDYMSIKSTIHDPEVVPLESVDLFVTPHFQQGRISNQYIIEQCIDDVAQKKKIDVYVGDARFWKAIDDSFETSQITKIQKHVGDKEPIEFQIRPSTVEYEIKGDEIVDIHPKH